MFLLTKCFSTEFLNHQSFYLKSTNFPLEILHLPSFSSSWWFWQFLFLFLAKQVEEHDKEKKI